MSYHEDERMSIFTKLGIGSAIILVVAIIGLLFFKPWGFVDNYELGYKYNAWDGSVTVLPHTGYFHRDPIFESIHTIDLRPRQVCITVGQKDDNGHYTSSANSRVLNCKLVKFNPDGLSTFIAWHGRGNYYDQTLDDLLKIYAYDGSGRTYPFLTILRELKNDDAPVVGAVGNTMAVTK